MKIKYIILMGAIILILMIPRSQKIFLKDSFLNILYRIKELISNKSATDKNLNNPSDKPSPQQGANLTQSLNYLEEMDKKDKTRFQKISKK